MAMIICFLVLAMLFLVLHLVTVRSFFLATPFLLFGIFEITWTWPAMIFAIDDPDFGLFPSALSAGGFLLFLLGYCLTVPRSSTPKKLQMQEIELGAQPRSYFLVGVIVMVVLCGLSLYLYQGLPPMVQAVRMSLTGHHAEAVQYLMPARENITKSQYFGGKYRGQGAIQQILLLGWPSLVIVLFAIFKKTKNKLFLALLVIALPLAIVFSVGTGSRFQLVMSIAIYIIVLPYLMRRIPPWMIAGVFMFSIALVLFVGSFKNTGASTSVDVQAGSIAERIAVGNGVATLWAMEFVAQRKLQIGWGRYHWEKLVTSLPGVTLGVPLSRQVQLIRYGNNWAGTSFASMTNLGVLYVDFSWPGVFVAYFLIGLWIGKIQRFLYLGAKTPLRVAFLAQLLATTFDLSIGSIPSYLNTLVTLSVLFAGVWLLVRACDTAFTTNASRQQAPA